MLTFKQFAIIGAELDHLSPEENSKRTSRLLLALSESGFSPMRFEEHSGGKVQTKFHVGTPKESDIMHMEMLAFDLFQQKSISVQYSDGHSRLHFRDYTEYEGKVRSVEKCVAVKKDRYFFYPELGNYYAVA